MRVRVVTYNVRSFRDDMDEVTSVVARLEPGVLLLQEAGSRRDLKRFAGSLDLQYASTHRPFRRVRNAVLVAEPWRIHGYDVGEYVREGRTIRRGYLVADIRAPGIRMTAVSTHLGLSAKERVHHARELTDVLAGVEGPAVVGVDLNEGPEGRATRWVAERLFDAFAVAGDGVGDSFPALRPTARIDYLFVTDGVIVRRVRVPGGDAVREASDHRPVVADVELPDAG